MKKKFNLNAAALLCTMAVSSLSAYSDSEITNFQQLKDAIDNSSKAENIGSTITFTDELTINKQVSISGDGISGSFTPSDKTSTKGAFKVTGSDSSLTLQNINLDSFGESTPKGVSYVIYSDGGDINIGPGVVFGESIYTARFGDRASSVFNATILMQNTSGVAKTLTLESAEDVDTIFSTQKTAVDGTLDIYSSVGNLSIEIKGNGGKVEIGNGIGNSSTSNTTITHSGANEFVLGGYNNNFRGTYTQNAGTTTFKGQKYFTGSSNINAGTFNWQANDDTTRGKLSFSNDTNLIVGDGSSLSSLTLKNTDYIAQAINLEVKQNSNLTLSGFTGNRNALTLTNKVNGSGTLNLTNDDITFLGESGGLADDLTLTTNGSKITLQALGADDKTLDIIAKASNSNSDIVLNGYTGTYTSNLDIDGTKLKTLTFQNTNNVTGNITASGTGKITNQERANTTITGNVSIEGEEASLVNDQNASLTITGSTGLKNKGKIDNKGTLTSNTLINEGTIDGSGTLTVNGSDTNALQNSGSISAASIEVTQGGVQNSNNITSNGKMHVKGSVTNSGTIKASDTLTVEGTLISNTDSSTTTMNGGSLNAVTMNGGSITNTGELTISGDVTGSAGTITHNSGKLTLSGNASEYTGKFEQNAGETTANSNTLFGGEKNIKGGTLSASGTNMYTGAVNLSGGSSSFDYTLNGASGSITGDLLSFSEGGGRANFTGNETDSVYTLSDKITGEESGSVTFKDTGLKLKKDEDGQFNYNEFVLDNSTLQLGEEGVDGEIDNFTFGKFTVQSGSKVDFDVQFGKGNTLTTDSLTVGAGSSGTLELGNIFISDESNVENGYSYATETNNGVLRGEGAGGSGLTLSGSKNGVTGATTAFEYNINVSDNGKGITADVSGIANEHSLYKMDSETFDKRFFQFSTDENEYHIDESLKNTLDGEFLVQGKSNDRTKSVLSGKLKKDGEEIPGNGSFFNIVEGSEEHVTGDVKLTVKNMTIQDAYSSDRGGSVLHNNSSKAKVVLDNLLIQNNSSQNDKGGAVYNNGGKGTDPSQEGFTGLYVGNTTFENNTSTGYGGAIYNDSEGFLYLENVQTASATGAGQNDIYNAGKAFTQGNNEFNSLYTNAEKGTTTFNGSNTLTELTNTSTEEDGVLFNQGSSNEVTNKFDNQGKARNAGTLTFAETSEFSNTNEFTNDANANLSITENATVTGAGGSITNNGNIQIAGNTQGYTGSFTQDGVNAQTTVSGTGSFFGGNSSVSAGTLNWYTQNDLAEDANLNITGGIFNIGDNSGDNAGSITFGNGSSITEGAITNIGKGSKLSVEDGGNVTLSNGAWLGDVSLAKDGNLTLNNLQNSAQDGGTLSADAGNLNLTGNTKLTLGDKSYVKKDVVANIGDSSQVLLQQGEFTLDSEDTWKGAVVLDETSTGKLIFDGYNSAEMGILDAKAGEIDIINESNITFGGEEKAGGINKNVKTKIEKESTVTLSQNGYLYLNDDNENSKDTWEGTVNLDGGTLYYGVQNPEAVGELDAQKGDLKLLKDSLLEIKKPSKVDDLVAVDIQQGATVDITNEAEFNISGKDSDTEKKDNWNGLVKNEGGKFTVKDMNHTSGNGGGLQQESGTSTFKNSDIYISDKESHIRGGNVVIDENSKLSFGAGIEDMKAENLTMSNNTQLGIMNGEINSAHADNVTVDGTANFTVDLNARNWKGDQFDFGSITGEDATLNVSDFNFTGGAPIDRYIDFTLFTGDKTDVNFNATKDLKFTPIGYYGLQSMGEGNYRAYLDHYNPQVFRGQVATMAMYTHQLLVDDMVTNHFVLHNDRLIDNAKLANKYAAASTLFAPYQKTYEDGGLWSKSYVSFDKLDLTQGLGVKNNIYGTLLGADLPSVELKNGWKFIPTGYIGYNGGHQHFNGVSMYQNGGQLGLMGTFIKNKFIGSVTAYGGGYMNDMSVAGFEDNAGNWFAGTAAKAAYNYTPFKDFTVQPNLFIAYNAFGKQNWGTDYGIMSMNSGMLNGVNVAPGLNLILQKKTWSLYGNISYMYFINDKIDGQAGNVRLPNVRMDHGYIQYGVGATKVWKDRLAAFGQVNIRNAGINGIGFQAGINYLFDFGGKKSKKGVANSTKPSGNAVYDDTHKTYIKKVVKRVENK